MESVALSWDDGAEVRSIWSIGGAEDWGGIIGGVDGGWWTVVRLEGSQRLIRSAAQFVPDSMGIEMDWGAGNGTTVDNNR